MVQISEATLAHVAKVCIIEKESFSDCWSSKTFEDLVDNPNAKFVVALDEEGLVGYGIIYLLGDQADIANIAVASTQRRKNIGEQLINEMLSMAKADGVAEVFLEVRESNIPAIKLYEKMDFSNIGRRKNYYVDPKEDALIMHKQL